MTDVALNDALRETITEVLEKMFFLPASELSEPAQGPEFIARVPFTGPPSGSLKLHATVPAARYAAADFLGEEESALSDQQIGEVIGELGNMICGSLLSRLESTSLFHLGAPSITYRDPSADALDEIPANAAVHAAEVARGAMVAVFHMDKDA